MKSGARFVTGIEKGADDPDQKEPTTALDREILVGCGCMVAKRRPGELTRSSTQRGQAGAAFSCSSVSLE
jgi:hypothetical protein